MLTIDAAPTEVFPIWRRAQIELTRHARAVPPGPDVLRTTGFLLGETAERVTDWYLEAPEPPSEAVLRAYAALERDTARLFGIIRRELGVRVGYLHMDGDPYGSAAELCADLRERRSMFLTTIACEDAPHPLLGGLEGGVVDQLRVVHDVFGHAALGLGFDLQSEFSTWLQCRTLFSPAARPAAFTELVGAVTAYISTGEKPPLVAKLPPRDLLTSEA
jgi:hypothetical protein